MTFDVLSDVNYLAVLVAAAAFFVFGAVYHAPPVFGNVWQRATGVEMAGGRPGPVVMLLNVVGYYIVGIGMGALAVATNTDSMVGGLTLGITIGLSLAVMMAIGALYETKPDPAAYILVNGLYLLLGSIIMGLIISVWR
jgi:uncharacterized protein DUF1761